MIEQRDGDSTDKKMKLNGNFDVVEVEFLTDQQFGCCVAVA